MKCYYHTHESAYQQIKEKGYVGWGNVKTLEELGDQRTKSYLKNICDRYFPIKTEKTALDIGCGTGTTAFLLADLGFKVMGVDISETAISMAHEISKSKNLKIKFQIYDVLNLQELNQKFDLIYDSHCLHCIVFEEDRLKVLSGIKESLSPNGIFILDTMAMPDKAYDPAAGYETLRFDKDFILWHKTKTKSGHGFVEIEGQVWCAQRRIYPSEKILEEVRESGFKIIAQQLDRQEAEPDMLRLVLI